MAFFSRMIIIITIKIDERNLFEWQFPVKSSKCNLQSMQIKALFKVRIDRFVIRFIYFVIAIILIKQCQTIAEM